MPTIIDVAREAGVSFKTVARVLNGEANVRAATKQKVLTAAKALDYRVNPAARTLRSKTAKRLALLIDNPSGSYEEATQIGAMLSVQSMGFQLFIGKSLAEIESFEDLVGVVLSPPISNNIAVIQDLERREVPFVRIGAEKTSEAGDRIGIDDRAAAKEMTEYLLGLGHRKIGFIKGDPDYDVSRRRFEGCLDAMKETDLIVDEAYCVTGDFSYESGLRGAEQLLSLADRPTAIFASNDEMASAALATAYKLNIRVPDALSVVGFDDAPVSRAIYPRLTTVQQSTQDMVGEAVRILADRISQKEAPLTQVVLPHKILERESSAPPSTKSD
ncbi:LacI family DNA-binding transcriptional regulator [Hellea balneolensis]|uniref:LacI family DNA-binding transcriptional regulator n=1 Tax=Hellea balneolensis TaxID=287478 RepID=UPI0004254FA7|nr:LacI family DNA-binding transcriptional regulator [Hellea balneolensis]